MPSLAFPVVAVFASEEEMDQSVPSNVDLLFENRRAELMTIPFRYRRSLSERSIKG